MSNVVRTSDSLCRKDIKCDVRLRTFSIQFDYSRTPTSKAFVTCCFFCNFLSTMRTSYASLVAFALVAKLVTGLPLSPSADLTARECYTDPDTGANICSCNTSFKRQTDEKLSAMAARPVHISSHNSQFIATRKSGDDQRQV